MNIEFL